MRLLVRNFVIQNAHLNKNDVVKHFVAVGMSRRTVYHILKRMDNNENLVRRPGQGRKSRKIAENLKNRLIEACHGKVGISYVQLAKKFKISDKTIKKRMTEMGIKRKARKKIVHSTERQKKEQRKRITKLSRNEMRASNDVEIIMDDETYLDENGNNFGGNNTYFVYKDMPVPDDVKYYSKKKFPKKLMVCIAISPKGHSRVYYHRGPMAITSEIYRNNCLNNYLLPFIRKHHSDGQYLFWPDLASAHYAKATIKFLEDHKVNFVNKKKNPPNMPQLRPIKTFFAHWKAKIYANGWKPENIDELQEKAKRTLRTFNKNYYETLMSQVTQKVRREYNRRPLAVVN